MTDTRRKIMQAVKSKGSKIELMLGKAMWEKGMRYRKHYKSLPGTPDFVIISKRVAIFVDSEFWHGKDWDKRKNDFKSNREFWLRKIERNIQRDEEVNKKLEALGWKVIRLWGNEIQKNIDGCIHTIQNTMKK